MDEAKMKCPYDIFYYPACQGVLKERGFSDSDCQDCKYTYPDPSCLTYLDMETDELV